MKLIFCPNCTDVLSLSVDAPRSCSCGDSSGQYINNLDAEIYGSAIPLGFTNISFVEALRGQPESGKGKEFTAFVIPRECPTVKKVER